MSEHDDWMAGLGVNVQALKAGSARGGINLFPTSLQDSANAPSPPPPKPAPPPKDALARAGDGRPYWQPAPVGSTAPPAADKAWLEAFLRFYRTGPPSVADPSDMTCSFNGATMTIAAALDVVDAQAKLNGYAPSRSTAAGLVKDLLKEGAESAALGDQVAGDVGGKGDLSADIARLDALS